MTALTLTRQLDLQRPLDEVYAYLADFSSIEQWDPGVCTADKVTPGPVRAGTEFALTLNVLGNAVPMQYRMERLDAIQRGRAELVLSGVGKDFSAVDTLTLTALDAGCTRLDYRAELALAPVPAILQPLLSWWGKHLGDAAMGALRPALEQDGIETADFLDRLGESLVLPGMWQFTRRGYRGMRSRGLSRPMTGRKVGITGVTAGLGLATAQLLGRLGADLVLVGRGETRLADARRAIEEFAGHPLRIECLEADLSSVADSQRLADQLIAAHPDLDVWINNAGALFDSHALTPEGHERALAVNLLTPALLARRLGPGLAARGSRLINVVSGGLYTQALRLDDMNFANESYNGPKAYARAKRALLDLTRLWAREPGLAGAGWHAMHPGWAATPGVASALPDFNRKLGERLRTPRMGCDTTVWLASHPLLANAAHSGSFWFDRRPRSDALLPGTATSAEDVSRLEAWVRRQIAC